MKPHPLTPFKSVLISTKTRFVTLATIALLPCVPIKVKAAQLLAGWTFDNQTTQNTSLTADMGTLAGSAAFTAGGGGGGGATYTMNGNGTVTLGTGEELLCAAINSTAYASLLGNVTIWASFTVQASPSGGNNEAIFGLMNTSTLAAGTGGSFTGSAGYGTFGYQDNNSTPANGARAIGVLASGTAFYGGTQSVLPIGSQTTAAVVFNHTDATDSTYFADTAGTVSGTSSVTGTGSSLQSFASLAIGRLNTAGPDYGTSLVLNEIRVYAGSLTQAQIDALTPLNNGQYSLAIGTGTNRIILGGTTTVAAMIANTGTTGANANSDAIAYTGLVATVSSGTIGGSATSGTVALSGTDTNSGLTFSDSITTGNHTINIAVSASNATIVGTAPTVSGSTTATVDVVKNRVVTASAVNLGRVMISHAVSGTSTLSTTGDNLNNTSVTVNGTLFNNASSTGSYILNENFGSTGVQSGTQTLTTTGEGLSGESAINVGVGYNATAVANRVVTASAVNLGRVMISHAVSGTSTLSTTGDNLSNTSVTVNGTLFNSASSTSLYGVNKTFGSTGLQSGTDTLTTTGEGLAGESAINVGVGYSATAVANRVVTASAVNLGRVMISHAVSGTSTLSTTGDNLSNTSVTVAGVSGTFNSASSTGSYILNENFGSSGVQSGTQTLTTTGEGLAGESAINVGVGYSATAVANRVVTASAVNLGRVMISHAVSGTSTLSTTGDNLSNTSVTVAGVSGTFNNASSTGSYILNENFGSTGVQSGTQTLTTTGEGLAGESAINVGVGYSATAVANRVVTASAVNLGRVMISHAVSGTSTLSTTGDNLNNTSVTVNGTLFNSVSSTSLYGVNKTFGSTGLQSGTDTLTTTGEGLAGESAINVGVGYSATAVANRVVSASTVNLGNVLVNTSVSATSLLSSTGSHVDNTDVTVTTGTATSGGVSVVNTTSQKFDGTLTSGSVGVGGTFTSSGSKSSSVTVTPTGEGLAGESVNGVSVGYTANVYDASNLAQADKTKAGSVDTFNVSNLEAGSALRAAANITNVALSTNVTGFTAATPGLVASGSQASIATFDTSNKLNGSYAVTASINATSKTATGEAISGVTANDAGKSIGLTETVSGNVAAAGVTQTVGIATGGSFAGYNTTSSGLQYNTKVELLGGTVSADTTVAMKFDTAANLGVTTDSAKRVADIVSISGMQATGSTGFDNATLTDQFVFQLSYTGTSAGYVAWYDSTLGKFVNAIAGNSTLAGGYGQIAGNWSLFQGNTAYNAAVDDVLGYYGYDSTTHTAWAVLDHNSDLTVLAVPEPSTWAMLVGGFGMMTLLRRRK